VRERSLIREKAVSQSLDGLFFMVIQSQRDSVRDGPCVPSDVNYEDVYVAEAFVRSGHVEVRHQAEGKMLLCLSRIWAKTNGMFHRTGQRF
jgi:hypothetical protein